MAWVVGPSGQRLAAFFSGVLAVCAMAGFAAGDHVTAAFAIVFSFVWWLCSAPIEAEGGAA